MSTNIFQPGAQSPLTTKGDIWVFGTGDSRLPVGSNNQILIADSTQTLGLKWGPVPASTAALITNGSQSSGFTAVGNNYYPCNGSGGTFLITLDVASGYSGQFVSFERTDNTPTKPISVKLSGSTTIHLNTIAENWTFLSDGANWITQGHYAKTAWATFGMSLTTTGGNGVVFPTGGVTNNYAAWRRDGNAIYIKWQYSQTNGSGGSNGAAGTYKMALPNSLAVTSDVQVSTNVTGSWATGDLLGHMLGTNTSVANDSYFIAQMYDTSNAIFLQIQAQATWATTNLGIYNTGGTINIGSNFSVTILNWEP